MGYSLLADLIVVVHAAFIVFVLLGALLLLKWRHAAWLHLPACLWGITVEFTGLLCPLTPLEIRFRLLAGEEGYSGSFVNEYLMPILYPPGLTRELQLLFGGIVLLVNLVLYGFILHRKLWKQRPAPHPGKK